MDLVTSLSYENSTEYKQKEVYPRIVPIQREDHETIPYYR